MSRYYNLVIASAVLCMLISVTDCTCQWSDDYEHSKMCVCDEQPEMKRFCDPTSVYCHHETGRCLNQTEAAEYFPERFNRTSPCYYVDGWQADDGLVYMNTCICNFTESNTMTRQYCGYMHNTCDGSGNCRTKPTTTAQPKTTASGIRSAMSALSLKTISASGAKRPYSKAKSSKATMSKPTPSTPPTTKSTANTSSIRKSETSNSPAKLTTRMSPTKLTSRKTKTSKSTISKSATIIIPET